MFYLIASLVFTLTVGGLNLMVILYFTSALDLAVKEYQHSNQVIERLIERNERSRLAQGRLLFFNAIQHGMSRQEAESIMRDDPIYNEWSEKESHK